MKNCKNCGDLESGNIIEIKQDGTCEFCGKMIDLDFNLINKNSLRK